MQKFKLTGCVTVSVYTTVEANSLEEAIEISKQREIERYNWGDKDQSKSVWVNEEFDGEVTRIEED